MAKLSKALTKKMKTYTAGSPFSAVQLGTSGQRAALDFLNEKALAKIKGVSFAVQEDIRKALINAQVGGQPAIAAASTILGQAQLEKGVFKSSRQRAMAIAKNELRAARQYGVIEEGKEEGYTLFTWISVLSKGTCPVCLSRHGQSHTYDTWLKLGIPPSPHYGCLCGLVPGRGIPKPGPLTRSQVRDLGVSGRIFRQVSERDYLKMRSTFVKCTNKSLGLK
jgi:hypothetical protein